MTDEFTDECITLHASAPETPKALGALAGILRGRINVAYEPRHAPIVAWRPILANKQQPIRTHRRLIIRISAALIHCAAQFEGAAPNHLCIVACGHREARVFEVIEADLIIPLLHCQGHVAVSPKSEVLAIFVAGMAPDARLCP